MHVRGNVTVERILDAIAEKPFRGSSEVERGLLRGVAWGLWISLNFSRFSVGRRVREFSRDLEIGQSKREKFQSWLPQGKRAF
ncbi:hypothetical protein ASPCAL08438 [Aspergillus calidoustus]|uniref:Uncharacterized protein n=1 Tax=Aspergillus calidoustus TaxID=454130 RepID=A0A0U5CQK3_ASPCI|nr:hypothetical protein ASPCAL08438 [Aspergillus calidoustus]